jgi:hypothetical protein
MMYSIGFLDHRQGVKYVLMMRLEKGNFLEPLSVPMPGNRLGPVSA